MASYEIVLKKNGRIMRRMGNYSSQKSAKNDAQVLADNAARGVKVYVQPHARRNNGNMHEYGILDAQGGHPPTKIGRGNIDYMAGYNAERARQGRAPLSLSAPPPIYTDARTMSASALAKKYKLNPKSTKQQLDIIYQQLGGGKFAAMVGLKQAMYGAEDENGYPSVTFRFPNRRGPNVMKVSITPQDLYDVRFYRTRKWDLIPKGEFLGVYASMLREIFERETGLYTKLFNPDDTWLQQADEEIEERGTEGAFTKQARRAGYSNTMEFAHKVMEGWRSGRKTVYNKKTRRNQGITQKTMYRANFAINAQKRQNPFSVSDHQVRKVIDDLKGRTGKTFVQGIENRTGLSKRAVVTILEDRLGYSIEGQGIGKPGFIRRQNPSWDQMARCEAPTTGRLGRLAKTRGYDSALHYAHAIMKAWHGTKKVKNLKTGKTNNVTKKLMQAANFTVNSHPGQLKNPSVSDVMGSIGRGAKKVGGLAVEGGRRVGEEAKRAALYAKWKDLEMCASRLGIDTDKLMDGSLDASATLNEIADKIESAEQALASYGQQIEEGRAARKRNPAKNWHYVAFTRPESGFRYFSRHKLKSTAEKEKTAYKRRGYKDVRVLKRRPSNALPVGLFAKV